MSSIPPTPKPRQRREHKRALTVLVSPTAEQPGTLLRITQDDIPALYWITPCPSDFGNAYRVERWGLESEAVYDVLLSDDGDTCTCPGHTFGSYCKHADAIRALSNAGKLAGGEVAP